MKIGNNDTPLVFFACTYGRVAVVFLLLLSVSSFAQTFTWMHGSDTKNPSTIYGTKGISSVDNTPGLRNWASSWVDLNNNLWLFGSYAPYLNDLWKYNIVTTEWTWVKGDSVPNKKGIYGIIEIPDSVNCPGARWGSATWTENNGNFWLFGGGGYDWLGSQHGGLNDLWKYNTQSNQWTWIKGSNVVNQQGIYGSKGIASSSNIPGARIRTVTWKDNTGNFWLFGGGGRDANGTNGLLGDMWKYDIYLNQWIWIGGSTTVNQGGNYGTIGMTSVTNIPGARMGATGWKDIEGNFWLFGGDGYDAFGNRGSLNDLWKYDISINEWVWMTGNNLRAINANEYVYYGDKALDSPFNTPGTRYNSFGWSNDYGLWFFGGDESSSNAYNDLWLYRIRDNKWVWLKGNQLISNSGVYGNQGIPTLSNIPGSRAAGVTWKDTSENFWLYGGIGHDAYGTGGGRLGDLWKLTIEPLVIDSQSLSHVFCSAQDSTALWVTASGRETIFYQWFKDSTVIPGAENDTLIIPDLSVNDTSTYWLMVYDVMDTIYSVPVRLGVLDVSAAITNELLCYNSIDGEITITAQGGFGSLSYSIDGSNFQSSNIFSGLSAGTYTGYVKDSLGFICATDTVILTNILPFVIETIITPESDSSSGSIRIKVLSGGEPPYTFSIDDNTFQDSSIFYGLEAGDYIVTVRDSTGCEDTVLVKIDSTVGLGNIDIRNSEVTIFPNPATFLLHVQLTNTILYLKSIRIVSITGQEMLIVQLPLKSNNIILNTQRLTSGIYFCFVILNNGDKVVKKVVIE